MTASPDTQAGIVLDTRRTPHARLRPVPNGAVRLEDQFWAPRLRATREVTLPTQYEACEATGRIDNFRRAAGKKQIDFQGRYYNDSDVYKWLEACCFSLAQQPDARLAHIVDAVSAEIAAAQDQNGYLNTYFTFERAPERWTNLAQMHEMYCAGHLMQAAVAHHRATRSEALLAVATRLADHICATFGPGIRPGTDGHEEIELALVELYRETGQRRYLERAQFFLDARGQRPPVLSGQPYIQDHLPVREQRDVVGHAVRATYLASGMVDVAAETGEGALLAAARHLWDSAFGRKAYITGALGAHHAGESFGEDYVLPNERAYAETCAAIGGIFWSWRLLAVEAEARYADWLETALYNGALSGISLEGDRYFYRNPLADRGDHRRQPYAYYATACCPPNIARLLASVPGYCYSTSADALWVHLYAAGTVRAALPGGEALALRVETRYPWDGDVHLTVQDAPDRPLALALRIPAWCSGARLAVNGETADVEARPGSYAQVIRAWRPGDELRLDLPMPVRRLVSHPRVLANTGRVALARGPLVYCLEAVDNPGVDVWDVELPATAALTAAPAEGVLGGIVTLRGEGVRAEAQWDGRLYAPLEQAPQASRETVQLTAVPYYAWANRSPGPMQVWLRQP